MNLSDNIVTRFLSRLCDFVLLNLLWILCSLPIFTIGASTTALYAVMLRLVKNEEGYLIQSFLKNFKSNFKKSTILWLIIMSIAVFIIVDFRLVHGLNTAIEIFFKAILLLSTLLLLCLFIYGFAMIARYENPLFEIIKNAIFLSIFKLPYTILILTTVAFFYVFTFFNMYTFTFGIFFWIFCGISLMSFIVSKIIRKLFTIFEQPTL